jgi:hypothetical protein
MDERMLEQILGYNRISEQLHAAKMGLVFRAIDTHLNRSVAVNELPGTELGDGLGMAGVVQLSEIDRSSVRGRQ